MKSEIAILLFGVSVLGLAFYQSVTVPFVHKSFSTGECMYVEPKSVGTCDSLPEKYVIQWRQ